MASPYFASTLLVGFLSLTAASAEYSPTEKKLALALEAKKGVSVKIDEKSLGEARLHVRWEAPRDADLEILRNTTAVRNLEIFDASKITHKGYAVLKTIVSLERLALNKAQPTAEGLVGLKELKNLDNLFLGEAKIGDASMAYFKQYPALRRLDLSYTAVTDKGLLTLSTIEALEELNLSHTKVTDEGIKHLKGHPKLKLIDVQNTKVTTPTIKTLEDAVKGITIRR